ncbi:MAG TPA: hypothetical protein VN844_20045, partial [Pyrinomonadaceae bacterium]|nr:hypothetical protein [Pyrinomonadaceae bacterium]
SPEQLKNMLAEDVDPIELTPASDIYSFAVTVYQLLTGRPPFSRNLADLIKEQMNSAFVPAGEIRPGLPPEVDSLIRQALDYVPDRRPQSAKQFGEEMARALETPAGLHTVVPVPIQVPSPVRSSSSIKYGLALVIVLILGIVSIWVLRKPTKLSSNHKDEKVETATTPSPVKSPISGGLGSPSLRTFSFWLDWTRTDQGKALAGGPIKASGQEIFTNGDSFVINLTSAHEGHLYLLNEGRNYNDAITFYYQSKNTINADRKFSSAELVFDNKDGIEQFWILISDQPVGLLESFTPPGEIPEGQTESVRDYLNRHLPSDISATEDLPSATTKVEGSGNPIAFRVSLRHRKSNKPH